MSFTAEQKLQEHLAFIYGKEQARALSRRILDMAGKYQGELPGSRQPNSINEKDVILIAYADIIREAGNPPLQTLCHFLNEHLAGQINTIHILPFYPYSSDDVFPLSIIVR